MLRSRVLVPVALAAALLIAALAGTAVGGALRTDADPCRGGTTAVGAARGPAGAAPRGGTVAVRGTVVGATPGLGGFFLEDAGDGDPRTSDGLLVHAPGVAVGLGDRVAARGAVVRQDGRTELTDAAVTRCAIGGERDLPRPTPLRLPASDDDRQRLDGMLVEVEGPLSVTGVDALTTWGDLDLAVGGVLPYATEVAAPGAAARAVEASDRRREIALGDGSDARTSTLARPYLSAARPVRVGDAVRLTAPVVLTSGFGQWRLEPARGTPAGLLEVHDARPAAPAPVGGTLRLAQFNVENWFLTRGAPGRGATTDLAFERQADKTVAAIRGLDADVLVLEEVEDADSTGLTPGDADTVTRELVRRLNAATGAGTYAVDPFPRSLYRERRDVIHTAIVYRPSAVQPVGPSAGWTDGDVWDDARQPVAQEFRRGAEEFLVVGAHLRSRGGRHPTGDDVDTGQGAYDGDRARQAASLARFVAHLEAGAGDARAIVLGDLNAYTREDPVHLLERAGLTDLGSRLDPGHCSYAYDGRSGSIDHALASAALLPAVTGATHWAIDSPESVVYGALGDPALYAPDPYRASDHDPLLVGLRL